MKYEEIYIKEYESVAELVQSLKQYFNFYNFERPHQALDGKDTRRVILQHSGSPEGCINKNKSGKRTP